MSYLDDPRVLFAAERTLLAWLRTAIALMALGFVIERFGLFMRFASPSTPVNERSIVMSEIIGVCLIMIAVAVCVAAARQFQAFIRRLSQEEIPESYLVHFSPAIAYLVAVGGVFLAIFMAFFGPR